MKATKIVVILVIIAVLGGGIYLIQNKKQKKALVVHNTKRFKQIIQAAEKSNLAGFPVMVTILKKYYQKTGHYPKDLMVLYPGFIPDKSFITELNWTYTPANGTYTLKRSIKGSDIFASMGPDMKLITGKEGAFSPVRAIVSTDRSKVQIKKAFVLTKSKSGSDYINGKNKVLTQAVSSRNINITKGTIAKNSKYEPEFTIVKTELSDHEKFLLSFNRSKLYIWKTSKGIIGFSDIQYPDEKQLKIYKDKSWIEYQENKKNTNKSK